MFRVNALFEAWLRQATEKPLASWKRSALLWRLQEDEELRCYAAELAQFSHETEPKGLSQAEEAWMRQRLMASLNEPVKEAPALGYRGAVTGLALALLVAGLATLIPSPDQPPAASQAAPEAQGEALALPNPTATVTPAAEKKVIEPGPAVTSVP